VIKYEVGSHINSLTQSCSLSWQLGPNGRYSKSEGVLLEGRKRQISFHNYKSTDTQVNFHKYGNVIFFKDIVAKASDFIIDIRSKWQGDTIEIWTVFILTWFLNYWYPENYRTVHVWIWWQVLWLSQCLKIYGGWLIGYMTLLYQLQKFSLSTYSFDHFHRICGISGEFLRPQTDVLRVLVGFFSHFK
jgi:hypothetical protein